MGGLKDEPTPLLIERTGVATVLSAMGGLKGYGYILQVQMAFDVATVLSAMGGLKVKIAL